MTNVVSLQASDDEKLAAVALTRDVERMAGTGLVVQLNALVVERQQTIVFFGEEPAFHELTLQHQNEVKREATTTLAATMPRILAVAGATPAEAASLVTIAIGQFTTPTAAPTAVQAILKAVQDRFKLYRTDAGGLASDLTQGAAELKEAHAAFAKHIEKEVAALDGPNGAIAKTMAQIEATRKAMEKALDDIVKEGNAVATGVQNLIAGIVHVFTSLPKPDKETSAKPDKETASKPDKETGSKPGGKPPTSETTSAKPSTTSAKPKTVAQPKAASEPMAKKTPEFSVESITAITSGIDGSQTAGATYQSHVETLIALYEKLHRHKATLAIAATINVQVGMLEASLRKAATAARAVQTAYGDIEQELAKELKDLKACADPAAQIAKLADRLDTTLVTSWRRLSAQAAIIKQNFAGTR